MKVYCPYCCEEVEYKIEKRIVKTFKGIKIDSYENVPVCIKCNQDLFIDEIEEKNNKRIYEKYRKKTNIIKPEDIIELRNKYDISQRELTSILDFGKMTINRYERGGIPSRSQSEYIKLLIDNDNKFIEKVKEAYRNKRINDKTYNKIISRKIKDDSDEKYIQDLYRKILNSSLDIQPNIYNGYKEFDIDIVENIISYISSKVDNLTITSLNKYLWFIDIISFNQRGISITGLTYQKQKYGPTIIDNRYTELSLLNDKYIRNDYEEDNVTKTTIKSKGNYDLNQLKPEEIKIIDKVIKLLKNKTVTDISNMSHEEEGWKKTKKMEKISFEYALKTNILKVNK